MKKRLRSQSGQMTVEAVLIITLLFGAVGAGTRLIKSNQLLSKLVEGPWLHLSGMMENGIWAPPEQGRSLHPNHINRHGSPRGDTL